MNLELNEEYGAGFEGTPSLLYKYIKDTPGQSIQQFNTEMKQKTYQEFEAQHKKMYPSHTTDQIKAAYKKYSEYFEMEEAYGESWVVYNKDTKAKIPKSFKNRKAAYDYAAKNGGVVYSAEYYFDNQDDINSGKLVKEESLDEAVQKIDVEELLDAAAKMRKEMPALRKGQSIMITLHNMNPKLYSMAVDKADAFTVDAKIPDLINFLDPKYYAESANLDEAMEPQNTSYGYYGTVDVEKYKLIAYKKMADTVLKIVRAKKIFANFPNITSKSDEESAVVKYLDSKHGRNVAEGNDSPVYIEKDFTKFLKDFAAGHYMESANLEEGNSFGGSLRSLGFVKMTDAEVKKAYSKWASKIKPSFIGWEQPMGKYAVGFGSGTDGRFFVVNKRNPSEIDFYTGEKAALAAVRNLKEESDLDEATGTHSLGTVTITAPENTLHGKTANIFHKFPDGRINVQHRKSDKKGDVINLTLKKGEYKLDEAVDLETARKIKIVALATGSCDLEHIHEFVSLNPNMESIVTLKETYNKYIQSL